jgi:hypothetical protein
VVVDGDGGTTEVTEFCRGEAGSGATVVAGADGIIRADGVAATSPLVDVVEGATSGPTVVSLSFAPRTATRVA